MEKKETIQEEIERLKKEGSKSLQYMLNDMEEILENTNNPRKKVSEEEQKNIEDKSEKQHNQIKGSSKGKKKRIYIEIDWYTRFMLDTYQLFMKSNMSLKEIVIESIQYYISSRIEEIETGIDLIKEKLNIKYPDE